MTTTVNDGAFKAVDAFFGVDSGKEEASSLKATATNKPSTNNHRLGVGASPSSSKTTKDTLLATSSQRILKVGSKKRRRQGYGHAADEEDDDDGSSTDHSSEDEQDQGRTAIDDSKNNEKTVAEESLAAAVVAKEHQLPQKKKLGKKERQRIAKEQSEKEAGSAPTATTTVDQQSNDDDKKHQQPANKRKRRKVRSRQKNIYKDKRDVKPAHLTPGHHNYQGRPLTAETRAKLHLPAVLDKSPFASDNPHNDGWEYGNWNDDTNGKANDSLDTMPLAVDQPVAADAGAPLADAEIKPTKTKRHKSPSKKYKNLA